jgi:hypothetical protein
MLLLIGTVLMVAGVVVAIVEFKRLSANFNQFGWGFFLGGVVFVVGVLFTIFGGEDLAEHYGSPQHIRCTSGGVLTLDTVSKGSVLSETNHFVFVDSSGKEVRIFGELCIITSVE